MNPNIIIRNARLHNLKNVSLEIPKNQLVVLTGLSVLASPPLPLTSCTGKVSANTWNRLVWSRGG
jgi:hypothetical protein